MKFEYTVVNGVSEGMIEDVLNQYGKDGWECIKVFEHDVKYSGIKYDIIFKRPVENKQQGTYTPLNVHIDKYEDPWLKDCVNKWKENNPCENCPSNPKYMPKPYIGDWPCQWCQHNPWKVTWGDNTTYTTNALHRGPVPGYGKDIKQETDEDWSNK